MPDIQLPDPTTYEGDWYMATVLVRGVCRVWHLKFTKRENPSTREWEWACDGMTLETGVSTRIPRIAMRYSATKENDQ